VVGLMNQPASVEHPGGARQVDGVDHGAGDLDPDLTRSRLDDGHFDDLDGIGTAASADDRSTEGGGQRQRRGCPTRNTTRSREANRRAAPIRSS
jgi:hypothetical protein